MPSALRMLAIVERATRCPTFFSVPWIRLYPTADCQSPPGQRDAEWSDARPVVLAADVGPSICGPPTPDATEERCPE